MSEFGRVLAEYRTNHRPYLSQSALAERAGFDHSYVSRCESGARMPSRAAVLALAGALNLSEPDTDCLLSAGGYMPGNLENIMADEPTVGALLEFLHDRSVTAECRDDVRNMVYILIRQARRVETSRITTYPANRGAA